MKKSSEPNQHIRMVCEGSCDTDNSALHHRNKLHFKIYENILFLSVIIYNNITFFTVFLNQCKKKQQQLMRVWIQFTVNMATMPIIEETTLNKLNVRNPERIKLSKAQNTKGR